ncbi:hypothetical protein CVT25_004723 [Psilocybe cyanescens]|uniref:Uncharacterized protein n=1 Tax=Psilocybe cyanescens TaxID=93625 RepID=A0A409XRT8_PSICY|nr:hypothetical protein CVT25_004723 [Psilocybe cyanescens]
MLLKRSSVDPVHDLWDLISKLVRVKYIVLHTQSRPSRAMHFTLVKLSLILVTLVSISKADIVAFSGNTCDGNGGSNVKCDGKCIGFSGRHSYRVFPAGNHCVTYFQNNGCSVNVGSAQNPGNGACSNVNTGTAVNSIRCSPNNVCQFSASVQELNRTVAGGDDKPVIRTSSAVISK